MEYMDKMDQVLNSTDYIDQEGCVCCGVCHTRKQQRIQWPLFDGTGRMTEHVVTVPCKCELERDEKEKADRLEREHRDCVSRLQSVCFNSPARKEHTFDHAVMIRPEIVKMAKHFVDEWETVKRENTGYLFWGDCGTGKSYTAACIANALMEKEIPVLMRNMSDFLNLSFEKQATLCEEIGRYGLVIFDDLGAERGTEYGLESVFRAINARCESGKPTIITTNLSLKELMNPYDHAHKRIYERVIEMCVPVQFSGPSIRPHIQQHKKTVLKKIFSGGFN